MKSNLFTVKNTFSTAKCTVSAAKNRLFAVENKFIAIEKKFSSKISGAHGAVPQYGFAAMLPSALLAAVLLLGGCTEVIPLESSESGAAQGKLAVATRSADGTVSYPVNVYVFGNSGSCVKTATLSSADDELSIFLPVGSYSVQAVGGASSDDYVLPTVDNAASDSPITLIDGHCHGDLMTAAQAIVKVGEDETNSLSLSMTRRVMQLCSVKMTSVPSDVTAVTVSISPLYKTLLLNGTCTGTNGAFTAALSKDSDGKTWSLESGAYLLEASGKASITVSMTTAEGTKTYSYESTDELKSNYKINITGTYKVGGFTVAGTITGTEWAGTRDITFEMTDGESGDESDDKGGTATVTAPEVGTIYMEKCFVVSNVTDETTGAVTTTLMTIEEKSSLTDTKDHTQEEWKELTDAGLAELAVDGITGWRLPTVEELKYAEVLIDENSKTYNPIIKGAGGTEMLYYLYRFCKDEEGNIKQLCGSNGYNPINPDAKTALRGFTTVTFTK